MSPKKVDPNLTQRNRFSSEELEKIKSTLQATLGDAGASLASQNIDERFTASEEAKAAEEAAAAQAAGKEPPKESKVDVATVLKEGRLLSILQALGPRKI